MSTKQRLPRRKPIDYTIMREAPFYDGMLTADERDAVRDFRELYELVLTAHYVRGLYVGAMYGFGWGTGSKNAAVDMVTPEGFAVMSIRVRKSTYYENDRGSLRVSIHSATPFADAASAPYEVFKSDKLATAVSFLTHGTRRRRSTYDPFEQFVPYNRDENEIRKIEAPGARAESVLFTIAHQLVREYELSTQYINLDSDCTTWAARCASGHVSMLDMPNYISSKITKAAEEYREACAEIEATLSKVREGLCRKKLMIGHGLHLGDVEKINNAGGPNNDTALIVATADFTPMYEALVQHVKNGRPSSDFEIKFDSAPRLYKSFNTLPEDIKGQIATKMIPINIRMGVSPANFSNCIFPNKHIAVGVDYLDELEALIHKRDSGTVNWYVVNY